MYGQYSRDGGRRLTLSDIRAYFSGVETIRRPKTCTKHNRAVITYADGSKAFVLYSTPIVTLLPNGALEFRDNGWSTMTTRRAMGEAVQELTGRKCYVYAGSSYDYVLSFLNAPPSIPFNCPFTLPASE